MKNQLAEHLPLVSVVTPAYNQGIFLRDTIESVLSQDYPNIELYVIDDGSTDETPQILAEYNGRIKWESHKNMGQTPTINKGWSLTSGEIVTWLNSDDTFLPGAVKTGVEYLINHPETGIVFGDTLFTEADGTPLNKTFRNMVFDYKQFVTDCENPIPQPSAFIRRAVVEKVGDLDPQFYYFMDWDFWLRAGLHFKIDYIPEVLSTYRLHAESKSVSQAKKAAPELEYMYRKYFSADGLPQEMKKLEKAAMMSMYFTTGGYYLQGNDQQKASEMAVKAVKQNPAGAVAPQSLRKFMYCMFSASTLYQKVRAAYSKLKR